MEFKVKDLSYGLLLSHTFPGLLFGLEILIAFQLFTNLDILTSILTLQNNMTTLITIFIIAFVFSTLLGFMLDGIHHFIFEDLKDEPDYPNNFFIACNSIEKMQLYKHFLEDDLWYPYEAYANIGIAMLPGIILLPYGLFRLGVNALFLIIISLLYFGILYVLFREANSTLDVFKSAEKEFIENFTNNTGTPAATTDKSK